ncbi:poly(hydroxyalkanoate) depolymerase family esterase [Pseudomonas duriflava]|uniref:Poly(Hydroxyalkanoate) depolymerase family esterase n=1 Tax=Pseudomonas duriflava TaxID=459528 RepID=A0A562Q6W2_9PSED|nr:PHB depolymerase family esterase [Pseudomonas duriflava]TWI52501.1 poly(hydroxyalkanoate) depolymerase family esterase [Pseudomonas duriflava]
MKTPLNSEFLDALRLTQSGQLNEATSLIQRTLGIPAVSDTTSNNASPSQGNASNETVLEGTYRVVDEETPTRKATGFSEETETVLQATRFGAALRKKLGKLKGLAPLLHPQTPRSAPEPVPEGAQFLAKSYSNHAGTREYKLYIPSTYMGKPLPMIVMLHGCKQNPDDFAAGTRLNELAETMPCLVLYPAQSSNANGSRCWNWFNPSDQHSGQGEPSLIAGMTESVAAQYSVDMQRIYVAGLSAGGAMAAIMAVTYPDLYSAAAIHSGLPYAAARDLPSAFAAMQQGAKCTDTHVPSEARPLPVPVIVFHGDRDSTVHPSNSEQIVRQFSPAGCSMKGKLRAKVEHGQTPDGHAFTRTLYRLPDNERVQMEQWTIHGATHAWSGGSTNGSYTDPRGPNATAEMLRFFMAQTNH